MFLHNQNLIQNQISKSQKIIIMEGNIVFFGFSWFSLWLKIFCFQSLQFFFSVYFCSSFFSLFLQLFSTQPSRNHRAPILGLKTIICLRLSLQESVMFKRVPYFVAETCANFGIYSFDILQFSKITKLVVHQKKIKVIFRLSV